MIEFLFVFLVGALVGSLMIYLFYKMAQGQISDEAKVLESLEMKKVGDEEVQQDQISEESPEETRDMKKLGDEAAQQHQISEESPEKTRAVKIFVSSEKVQEHVKQNKSTTLAPIYYAQPSSFRANAPLNDPKTAPTYDKSKSSKASKGKKKSNGSKFAPNSSKDKKKFGSDSSSGFPYRSTGMNQSKSKRWDPPTAQSAIKGFAKTPVEPTSSLEDIQALMVDRLKNLTMPTSIVKNL